MADVTDVTELKSLRTPGIRAFNVTASDAETFTPPGFSGVEGCVITQVRDPSTGNPVGYELSGNTITIHCASASDVVMTVLVFGQE
jgi:hypothetical protein